MCVCVAGVLEADGKLLGTRKSTVWYVAAPPPPRIPSEMASPNVLSVGSAEMGIMFIDLAHHVWLSYLRHSLLTTLLWEQWKFAGLNPNIRWGEYDFDKVFEDGREELGDKDKEEEAAKVAAQAGGIPPKK